jgi:hypothetical protein
LDFDYDKLAAAASSQAQLAYETQPDEDDDYCANTA